jgi:CRP-like cAMP-binding protein
MSDRAIQPITGCKECKLRKQNSFCNLPSEALLELERIKQMRTFAPRARLFGEGDPVDQLMIVCEGAVALTLSSSVGNSTMLGLSQPGEVLGLSSAVTDHPHEVTAEAIENTRIAAINRADFIAFLARFPAASANANKALGNKVFRAYERLRLSAPGLSVRQKLAGWLPA